MRRSGCKLGGRQRPNRTKSQTHPASISPQAPVVWPFLAPLTARRRNSPSRALSDAFRKDIGPLGIRVIVAELGAFRTAARCRRFVRQSNLWIAFEWLAFGRIVRGKSEIVGDYVAMMTSMPRFSNARASSSRMPSSVMKEWMTSSVPRRVKEGRLIFVESATR